MPAWLTSRRFLGYVTLLKRAAVYYLYILDRRFLPIFLTILYSCDTVLMSLKVDWDIPDIVLGEPWLLVIFYSEINETITKIQSNTEFLADLKQIHKAYARSEYQSNSDNSIILDSSKKVKSQMEELYGQGF